VNLFPEHCASKLGFDVVLERLREHIRGGLGADRLAAMRPSRNPEWIRAELRRTDELREALRFDDPVPLDHLLDVREVVRRVAPEDAFVSAEDFLALRLALSNGRLLRQYFDRRKARYPALADTVQRYEALPELEKAIERVIDEEGLVRDDASPGLREARRGIARLQTQLRETLHRELRAAVGQGYATEDQPTVRGGRMVIPVRAEARRRVPGVVQDTSATGQTVYIEPSACIELNNDLRTLEFEERREVERILRTLSASLRAELDAVRNLVRMLAMFDLLQAKARLAQDLDALVPEVAEEALVDIKQGRNAVLALYFRRSGEPGGVERQVVPLDLSLGADRRTLVVTGPNAGGKTVAMKTVGLFALMIAHGIPVPVAPGTRIGVFEHLMVDLGDEQSMEDDLSTFSSHVANLRHMLRKASRGSLILIDEAGTGTDPAEGGALAQAVLERLTERGALTIATTHHGTLKAFAHETGGVENGSMEFDEATLSPTYRFRAGIPGSSYAFDIASRTGLDSAVLDRARVLAGESKVALETLISTFEEKNRQLEKTLNDSERVRREAEAERKVLTERRARIREERDAIRRQALDEAKTIVSEANARVERTIREIREAEADRERTKIARQQLAEFEQSVEIKRNKIRPVARPIVEETAPSGPIGLGDQVVLEEGGATAEVVEILGRDAVVAVGSMRVRTTLKRLRKVGGPRKQEVRISTLSSSTASPLVAKTHLDLRGQRVDEALSETMRFVDDAVSAGLDSADILHGTGTGALRHAIREQLQKHPDVASFEDAPWEQGGPGVTRIAFGRSR
jgi:DNA mismatch repair protein MutS2